MPLALPRPRNRDGLPPKPPIPVFSASAARYGSSMFSIEHDFDATVVTLVDEGGTPLQEDVIISSFEECVTVTQYDPRTDREMKVTLSITQMNDLIAAVNLPEGIYRRNG